MGKLFMPATEPAVKESDQKRHGYGQKYRTARYCILASVILTALNILLSVLQLDYYFLYSLSVPYYLAILGMIFCGKYPEEFYTEELSGLPVLNDSFLVTMLILAGIILAVYLLSFFLSRNGKVGWLIFGLVFISIDTVLLLLFQGIVYTVILDILFHVWIIVELAIGIRAHYKLQALPAKDVPSEKSEAEDVTQEPRITYTDAGVVITEEPTETGEMANRAASENSLPLRPADRDVKHRVLLEKHFLGYDICYRRVKRTNELIINGYVYDELEGLVEPSHALNARIDGHTITVGFDSVAARSYLTVDGQTVAQKLRLY